MYFVYVLQSFKDKKFYIGYTENLKRRVSQHLWGRVITIKSRLSFRLIYYKPYISKKEAKGREKFLKGGSGHQYQNISNLGIL